MQLDYHPRTKLEKFGQRICGLLVDNFPQTFYVGGMVRDVLLGKNISDIDIATEALPGQVAKILSANKIHADSINARYGVVMAKAGKLQAAITTFRKDLPSRGRYPKIAFAAGPKQDSSRRDFTINALYLSPKTGQILDFHQGLEDITSRHIRFIGKPASRIKEDPLRIVRAIRFAITLNLKIEHQTDLALEKYFDLVKTVTRSKLYSELKKIRHPAQRKIAETILQHKKTLDSLE